MRRLAIAGAGGHALVCADIARLCGYGEVLFFDDDPLAGKDFPFPVEGPVSGILSLGCEAFVAIGSNAARSAVQSALEGAGVRVATLVHPSAYVAPSADLGPGCAVMAGAVVNPYARLGRGCVVNTCASVDHGCSVGDFCHVAVGARLAGDVTLGEKCMVGAGAVVIQGLRVAGGAVVGAGAAVVRDVEAPGTYAGVPARPLHEGGR